MRLLYPSCFIALLLIAAITVKAQQFNLPVQKDQQYILINNQGKQVLSKAYDKLQWISGPYFMGTTQQTDTAPLVIGQNRFLRNHEGIKVTDLIFEDKIVIANSPFQWFTISEGGIISGDCSSFFTVKDKASLDKYGITEENKLVLFNKNGQPLLKKALVDAKSFTPLGFNKDTTHIFFLAETSEKSFEVCLFDIKKQQVTQTLLSGEQRMSVYYKNTDEGIFIFNYYKKTGEDMLTTYVFDGKKLEFKQNDAHYRTHKPQEVEMRNYDISNINEIPEGDHIAKPRVGEPNQHKNTKPQKAPEPIIYFTLIKDTAYQYPNSFSFDKAKVVGFNNEQTKYKKPIHYASQGIISCTQGGCEIITANKKSGTIYKDADYIGINFYLVKNQDNKVGILNKDLQPILALIYDSIQIHSQQIVNGAVGYQIVGKNKYAATLQSFNTTDVYASAFKNGKVSIYNSNFTPHFTEDFDGFYKHTSYSYDYFPAKSEKHIAKKGNQYFVVSGFMEHKKTSFIGPFEGYPLFAYYNYYGIKDLTIYRIYDQQFKFIGLADASGKMISHQH